MKLQEDLSYKFTDLWMEVYRASSGGDLSKKFPDLGRKLCRSSSGEAAGRLEPEVHRPVDGALQGQHWWRLRPEVPGPVEEVLQVQHPGIWQQRGRLLKTCINKLFRVGKQLKLIFGCQPTNLEVY